MSLLLHVVPYSLSAQFQKKALSIDFSKASLMYNALLIDRRIVYGFHKRQKRRPALKSFDLLVRAG